MLVVGATGAVGRHLVPQLVRAGHEVVAAAQNPSAGVSPGVEVRAVDLLDATAVVDAVKEVAPDAVIHQVTALTELGNNLRKFDQSFAATDRLRTHGTRALIEAGLTMPRMPRLVAQSFCGWTSPPTGGPVKTEDEALDPNPAPAFRQTFAAIRELESLVSEYPNGVALRCCAPYGPGTSLAKGGAQIEAIRTRRFTLVGEAGAIWSFLHVEDAPSASVAALTQGHGVYNIVDDHPVRIGHWLIEIASITGFLTPRRVPAWVARIAGGQGLVYMMTRARGSSNTKARRELGWKPSYPDWGAGFEIELRRPAVSS
ncbi:NAD(P)-dependent oxidoreductase [Humibacillus sp. DSM 29435]|uniref:NAD-dependent epimerase/dehydratase family protein n=1 Tax=Humibacillus sp. DSM 29435 TaxID=1869167 RepID=UPI001C2F6BA8|nr:NAD-dependent epimerase/dehydratase family protein [Humibacillus sp. DSM 29435]